MKKWEEPNASGSFNGAGRICCYLKEIIIRFSLLGEIDIDSASSFIGYIRKCMLREKNISECR